MSIPAALRASRTKRSVTAGLALCALAASHAHAANLTLQATGTETGSWASNPLMAISGARPLWGSTTSPSLILQDTAPDMQLGFNGRIDENIFNQAAFDSTDVHAHASLAKKSERWGLNLGGGTDYDTTRTSELSNFGLPATVVTRHLGLSLAPQVSYAPNARDSLRISGSAYSSQYESNQFVNYDLYTLTPSFSRRLDPLNSAVVSLEAQRYTTTRNTHARVDSLGPSIGWQGSLSPRFSANAAIGAQTSRQYTDDVAVGPWQWSAIFDAGLNYKDEQDSVSLTARRDQSPYGNGTDGLQTNFALTETHALNPLVSLNVGAQYLTAGYQASTLYSIESRSGGNAGVTWHATETLDVTAGYQYSYEALTGTSQTVQDHTVTLGLALHPGTWTLLQ
ncbi:MAG: hypothetical protein P4M15_11195 [Alphaproteobacteria bacterium]|nr:hypothetical protein [Alphaproteobacteria bacterium]